MNEEYFNTSYTFTLGGIRFSVDVDISLSAAVKNENYQAAANKVLHYHPMHELFFVFNDPIIIKTEAGVSEYKNCILSIPPHTKHSSERISDYRILFSFGAKNEVNTELFRIFNALFSSRQIFSIDNSNPELKTYFEEFSRLFYNRDNFLEREPAVSLLKLIFYRIYLLCEHSVKISVTQKESYYLIISRLIAASTKSDSTPTLSTAAEALHLSEKQTSRIISRYFGKPFSALVNEAKLDYSKYLLESTSLSVSEIALQSNFRSENYFYSQFKKAFGTTPLQYRKRIKGSK